MEKQTAINLLGGTAQKAAQAMGYKSPHAVYMWPDVLKKSVSERVLGIAGNKRQPRKAKAAA